MHVVKAHSDDITGLKFSTDGLILLSRSLDSTLKVTSCTCASFSFHFFIFSMFAILQISCRYDAIFLLQIWDLRQMKTPLKAFQDLPNHYAQTNAAFSPDEQLILTGTSIEKEGTSGGLLCFFNRRKLELVSRVGISPNQSVVCCAWHARINQVCACVFCYASNFH